MLHDKLPKTPYGELPPVIRALDISFDGAITSAWLEQCLANDSAVAVKLEPATIESAMTSLRQEFFDVVILHDDLSQPAEQAIEPLRTASPDHLAIVVIGSNTESESPRTAAIFLDAGADAYVCQQTTDVRTVLWTLARAVERQRLLRDVASSRKQIELKRSQDHQDAVHQLRTQRSLLLEHVDDFEEADPNPPSWLVDYFQDLLKMYVVSGSGNHRDEVTQLVDRLDHCEVTLSEALAAHTLAAEQLVLSLGNRPAWHILGRANLLALELIMQRDTLAASKQLPS